MTTESETAPKKPGRPKVGDREPRKSQLGTAVNETEKAAFERFCQEKNTNPSALIRLLLSKVCPAIAPGPRVENVARPDVTLLRLSVADGELLQLAARNERTTRPGWVRKVVLAALKRSPQFNPAEVQALRESNRELAAIGRNLNQIAHYFNIHKEQSSAEKLGDLQELVDAINAHRRRVSGLINANWGRLGTGAALGEGDQ